MQKNQRKESFTHQPWVSTVPPKKILVIRFHAFGDVTITLPYLQALKNALPDVEIHFLTRKECSDFVGHMTMFTKVFSIDDNRNGKLLFIKGLLLFPSLAGEQYDVVLDLQRNTASRMIRKALQPNSFSEFDRFSMQSAGERVRQTINALELTTISESLPELKLKTVPWNFGKWISRGFVAEKKYVLLNPAGSAVTKNWPIENYERFAFLWLDQIDPQAQFLMVGTERIHEKAKALKQRLGSRLIDLVGLTTEVEAFKIMQNVQFVLSEDSGLMHMAWISKVPLVALFGSTPSVWSRPLGESSMCLDSSDLECGNCNRPTCAFGDVHCLTRFTPEMVLEEAKKMIQRNSSFSGKDLEQ